MYPDKKLPDRRLLGKNIPDVTHHFRPPHLPAKQRGFLMPLAIFIVVIMGFFIATISRTTSQTAIASTQEGISLQAFYAAESGAQQGMSVLFYDTINPLAIAAVNGRCTAMALTPAFNVTGLRNCSASVSCSADTSVPGKSFYTITSVGQCGSGNISANRTVQVSAKME